MAGLDGLTNRKVSYSSDSRRVPATVLGELMPAGCHMDGAYDSVGNAYALIRRLADTKAPQNPILHMPAEIGLPRVRRDRSDGCRERLARNVRALRILWVEPRRGHSKAPAGWTFAKQQQAVTMSRPTKTLVHDGEEWLAMLTGGDTSRQEYQRRRALLRQGNRQGGIRTPARHPSREVQSRYGGSTPSGIGHRAIWRRGLTSTHAAASRHRQARY